MTAVLDKMRAEENSLDEGFAYSGMPSDRKGSNFALGRQVRGKTVAATFYSTQTVLSHSTIETASPK